MNLTRKKSKNILPFFVIYVISYDDSIYTSRIFKFTARNETEDVGEKLLMKKVAVKS